MNLNKTETFNAVIGRSFKITSCALALLVCSVSCTNDGPFEKAGKSVDKTIDDAEDTVDTAGDKAGKAIDGAEDAIDNAADKVAPDTSH